MAACKSCGASIRWALSAKSGKPIPIDAEPVTSGNLVIVYRHGGDEARIATDEDRKLKRDTFVSHFATCPDAPYWRGQGS